MGRALLSFSGEPAVFCMSLAVIPPRWPADVTCQCSSVHGAENVAFLHYTLAPAVKQFTGIIHLFISQPLILHRIMMDRVPIPGSTGQWGSGCPGWDATTRWETYHNHTLWAVWAHQITQLHVTACRRRLHTESHEEGSKSKAECK